jgi:hypothetical protein
LSALFSAIYGEQIAGYYDPETLTLYAVSRGDRTSLVVVLSHELVHALQHQYLPLDSIMKNRDDADRTAAAQSVLEGQAQVVSMMALLPGQDLIADDSFWAELDKQLRSKQGTMPVFSHAPLVIREGLLAPYLRGAEFVRWFRHTYPGEEPYGKRMPASTEQILHTDRYAHGDMPVTVRFAEPANGVTHEDTFGELEITVLRSMLAGIDEVPTDVAMDWGGDRYRVYRTPDGPALIWMTVWDNAGGARRFHQQIGALLLTVKRVGYRTTVEDVKFPGRPGVRVVIAPEKWARWKNLPVAEVRY